MTETKWFKILSFLHLTVVLSLCFGVVCTVTLSMAVVPAICAAFSIGKDLLEKKYDVYEGLIRRFVKELRKYGKSMRYLPVWLLVLLQAAGIMAAGTMGNFLLQTGLLVSGAFLLVYLFYACFYMVFIDGDMRCEEVFVRMFGQIKIVISLFCLMILILCFFQLRFIPVLFLCGSLLILVIEAVLSTTLLKKDEDDSAVKDCQNEVL